MWRRCSLIIQAWCNPKIKLPEFSWETFQWILATHRNTHRRSRSANGWSVARAFTRIETRCLLTPGPVRRQSCLSWTNWDRWHRTLRDSRVPRRNPSHKSTVNFTTHDSNARMWELCVIAYFSLIHHKNSFLIITLLRNIGCVIGSIKRNYENAYARTVGSLN